jgi:acetyl-CoA carboxylase biotin carboxylase subunit
MHFLKKGSQIGERMFKKILIANRSEIAVRVIRACREMGIRTVAVYSDVDQSALHVQMADEAVCLGPAPPLESYLNMDAVFNAAHVTGAEAIHPGYGFLAENGQFSARCEREGFVFIGPSSRAQNLVGDKVASRKNMAGVGVPIIPGMQSVGRDTADFQNHGRKMGYPVMIKASAGGGGKGMRIVSDPTHLANALEEAMREAKSAFGDSSVYLEKCIVRPRHVEFQILADHHGNAVHLFERECSIQRRHQKLIEETPSTALEPELRERMGNAALDVVRATGYTNAGTVEFLLDEDKQFYFLEVNARIQVEHPITEMVTGLDLVKWQIRIAAGERLPFTQEDILQNGHAIECRIYAEDPANSFFPSLGKILFMKNPQGPGVRLDSGIYSGYDISRFYDPILSKLVVWGSDREEARKRMTAALNEYVILGIKTTIPFLIDVLNHPKFISGDTATDFIGSHFSKWNEHSKRQFHREALIAAAILSQRNRPADQTIVESYNPWQTIGEWHIGRS